MKTNQNETLKQSLYTIFIFAGIILASMIYFQRFNKLSQTQMIKMSYIWFPFLLFGLFGHLGLRKAKNSLLIAALGAILGTGLLILFYEAVFPIL